MLITSFSVKISYPSCSAMSLQDTTCDESSSCACGYSASSPAGENITRDDVVKTVWTLTTPTGIRYVVDKGYLPTDENAMQVLCSDLTSQLTPTTVTTQSSSSGCGCSSTVTVSPSTTCFNDGCWSIKYDVYVNTNQVCYTFDTFPVFIETIDYNSADVVINKACGSITEVAAALNTATTSLGTFTVSTDNIEVCALVQDSSLYGDITLGASYTYDFGAAHVFFPDTMVSFSVNSVAYTVNTTINILNNVVTTINSFSVGTAYLTSQSVVTVFSQNTFGNIILSSHTVSPTIAGASPPEVIEPETSVVAALYASTTQQEFISCTIKKELVDLKLRAFSENCAACGDIQFQISELDSDYDTVLIVAGNESGLCGCSCAGDYYNLLRAKMNRVLNQCF